MLLVVKSPQFNNLHSWLARPSAKAHTFLLPLPVEHSGHQPRASARSVSGQHEVKLVVNAHELADPALHYVGEVRVVPEDRPVNGDDNIMVVHFLEECRDACRHHEARTPRHALADIADSRAIIIDDIVSQAEVGKGEGNV